MSRPADSHGLNISRIYKFMWNDISAVELRELMDDMEKNSTPLDSKRLIAGWRSNSLKKHRDRA